MQKRTWIIESESSRSQERWWSNQSSAVSDLLAYNRQGKDSRKEWLYIEWQREGYLLARLAHERSLRDESKPWQTTWELQRHFAEAYCHAK